MSLILDPNLGLRILNCIHIIRRRAYNILRGFWLKANGNQILTGETEIEMTNELLQYVQLVEKQEIMEKRDFDSFTSRVRHLSIDFDDVSMLRKITCFVLAAPASVADLERIWSECLLTLSLKRLKIQRENDLKTIRKRFILAKSTQGWKNIN